MLLPYPVIGTPVTLLSMCLQYCYLISSLVHLSLLLSTCLQYCYLILSLVLLSLYCLCVCNIVTSSCLWYSCHFTVYVFAMLLPHPVIGTPVTLLSMCFRYCYLISSLVHLSLLLSTCLQYCYLITSLVLLSLYCPCVCNIVTSSCHWYSCHFTVYVFAILLPHPVIGTPATLLSMCLQYCYLILSLVLLSFYRLCVCDVVASSCQWYSCYFTVHVFAILLPHPVIGTSISLLSMCFAILLPHHAIGTAVTLLSMCLQYCYLILSLVLLLLYCVFAILLPHPVISTAVTSLLLYLQNYYCIPSLLQ
jgi:hypothetical protein